MPTNGMGQAIQFTLEDSGGHFINSGSIRNYWTDASTAERKAVLQLYSSYQNAERLGLAINWDGNVGIGTTSPTEELDVAGTVKATMFVGDGSQLTDAGDPSYASSASSPNDAVFVDDSGNVGIGTATPGAKLEIYGSGPSGFGTMKIVQPNNNTSEGAHLFFKQGIVGDSWIGHFNSPNHGSGSQFNIKSENPISFSAGGNGSANQVMITTNGNVGIGTTSPESKLHVKEGMLWLTGLEANTRNIEGLGMFGGKTNAGFYFRGGNNPKELEFLVNDGDIKFVVGPAATVDVAVIKNNGNVGIGTSSPTKKLDVAGTVKATAFVGDGSGLTDAGDPSYGSSAGSPTDAVFVNDSGNIGIGTNAPSVKLHVDGDVRVNGVILTQPSGALSMGSFTAGPTP